MKPKRCPSISEEVTRVLHRSRKCNSLQNTDLACGKVTNIMQSPEPPGPESLSFTFLDSCCRAFVLNNLNFMLKTICTFITTMEYKQFKSCENMCMVCSCLLLSHSPSSPATLHLLSAVKADTTWSACEETLPAGQGSPQLFRSSVLHQTSAPTSFYIRVTLPAPPSFGWPTVIWPSNFV